MPDQIPINSEPKKQPSLLEKMKGIFVKKQETEPKIPQPERSIQPKSKKEGYISKTQAKMKIEELEKRRSGQLEGRSKMKQDLINEEFDKQLAQIYKKVDRKELFKLEEAEDYIDLINALSPQEQKALQLEAEYGKGRTGKFKAFLAGEHDFKIYENGEIKRQVWMELLRKATVTVFNRRTALQVSALGVIGILTGGVGSLGAGIATILGSQVGRGGVEAWESINGKEGNIRRKIAEANVANWAKLKQDARGLHNPELTEEERNQKIINLVEGYCKIDNEVMTQKEELRKTKLEVDKLREKWTKIGAWAGLGTNIFAHGFLTGLTHLKEIFTHLDINGDKIFHDVTQINGVWNFLYNKGEAFAQTVQHIGGKTAHAIVQEGAGWSQYFWGAGKNLLRDFGVLTATYLASMKDIREYHPLQTKEVHMSWLSQKEAAKITKPLADKQENMQQKREAQVKERQGNETKEQAEEQNKIAKIKKYFRPGQLFGILNKTSDETKSVILKEITEDGGVFAEVAKDRKVSTKGKILSWKEILGKNLLENGLTAEDLNLYYEGKNVKENIKVEFITHQSKENYKWLKKNEENLKYFEILRGQKVYAITGEGLDAGEYELDNIDLEKNTLWLELANGIKLEFYIPWFLEHKKQFKKSIKEKQKAKVNKQEDQHKATVDIGKKTKAVPKEIADQESEAINKYLDDQEKQETEKNIKEVTLEEWEHNGKKHLSAKDDEGNNYRVDDKYLNDYKAGNEARARIIDTGKKDKKGRSIISAEPIK